MTLEEARRWGFYLRARNGRRVYYRPVTPEDRERLARGYRLLSEQTRRLRFVFPLEELPDDLLTYLTQVDQKHHVAWGAMDPADPELPGIGVGRWIRLAEEPTVAEAALVVIDAWQGQGVGLTLGAVLYLRAMQEGLAFLRGYILPENRTLLKRLRDFGAAVFAYEEGMWMVQIPVYPAIHALPNTVLGRALKHTMWKIVLRQPRLFPLRFKRRASDAVPGQSGPHPAQ